MYATVLSHSYYAPISVIPQLFFESILKPLAQKSIGFALKIKSQTFHQGHCQERTHKIVNNKSGQSIIKEWFSKELYLNYIIYIYIYISRLLGQNTYSSCRNLTYIILKYFPCTNEVLVRAIIAVQDEGMCRNRT